VLFRRLSKSSYLYISEFQSVSYGWTHVTGRDLVKQSFELRNNFCLLKVWVVQNFLLVYNINITFAKKNYQNLRKKKNLKMNFVIIPDIISMLILVPSLIGMYQGIEISHPVFSVLFANMVWKIYLNIFFTPCEANKATVFVLLSFSSYSSNYFGTEFVK